LSYGRERQGSKIPPGKPPTIPYLARIVKSKCSHVRSTSVVGNNQNDQRPVQQTHIRPLSVGNAEKNHPGAERSSSLACVFTGIPRAAHVVSWMCRRFAQQNKNPVAESTRYKSVGFCLMHVS